MIYYQYLTNFDNRFFQWPQKLSGTVRIRPVLYLLISNWPNGNRIRI
jgi:hypothetical protein